MHADGPAHSAALPSERTLERYLAQHIPLSRALGVRVERFDAFELRLRAPLEPNLNHRHTAFGGSLSALAILAGWTRVAFDLRRAGRDARVVVQRSHIDFDAPAEAAFEARVEAVPAPEWDTFLRTLERRGKARVGVRGTVRVSDAGDGADQVARFAARYVALGRTG